MENKELQDSHIIKRNTVVWTSYGKFHDQPAKTTLIKDLSDSHLMRLFLWVRKSSLLTKDAFGILLQQEMEFRTDNYIFVPDYE